MKVLIRRSNQPVDNGDLLKFEKSIGIELPEKYREFLSTYNGGQPDPNAFLYKDKSQGSLVDYFLGLDVAGRANLERYYHRYKDRIPGRFIPIAYDPGGNLIVIGTAGETNGQIFFWDHEMEAEEDEQPDMSNMHLVADSFEEFLAELYEIVID
ncbi:MAG: SMI1/KNR4 family protein [Stappiaceae bacterium]